MKNPVLRLGQSISVLIGVALASCAARGRDRQGEASPGATLRAASLRLADGTRDELAPSGTTPRALPAFAMPAAAHGLALGDVWVHFEESPRDAAAFLQQSAPASAPAGHGSDEELAKKLANPIADLISVPLQSNFDFGIGPGSRDGFRYTLNVQPVVPVTLNEDWNVIIRTIVPVIYQEDVIPNDHSQFGLGDTLQSFFFSPKPGPGDPIWGAGPVFLWPTATDSALGQEKWGIGPTGVVLAQSGPWTYGFLGNHVWSYAGDPDRPYVSQTFLQPFVAHVFPSSITLGVQTETTYDWRTNQWTVPLIAYVSEIFKFGELPVSIQLAGKYWAEGPIGAPEWGIRLNVIFLLPK